MAVQQKGSTAVVAVGVESTPGTLVVDAGFELPINTDTVMGGFARNSPATLTGDRNPVVPFAGNKEVTGDIVVPLDDEAFWYWLQLAFGDPTTSGAGDPYTHVFKITDTQPSFSHVKEFTDLATDKWMAAVGCKISSMAIEFGGDGELVATFSVVGFDETIETSNPFTTPPTAVALDERYNNFNAVINEGGGANSLIKTFSLNVDFGLDTTQRTIAGAGALGSIPEGIVSVTGNIKGLFEDTVILEKGRDSTESSLELVLTSAVTASHILTFDINELLYSFKTPVIEGPTGLDIDLDFVGYYTNDAAASALVVTNINASAHA